MHVPQHSVSCVSLWFLLMLLWLSEECLGCVCLLLLKASLESLMLALVFKGTYLLKVFVRNFSASALNGMNTKPLLAVTIHHLAICFLLSFSKMAVGFSP